MQTSPYSAPVDFEFYNDDQEPVLFLTDEAAGHQMTLLLSNTSAEGISYGSVDDYHFELVFRPQTLKNPEGIQIQSSGYSLIGAPHINEDGTLSIFIKSDDTKPWAEKEEILLSGFRAEAGIGTRGTRIMLRYKNLLHGAGDFSGNKEEQLSIVNDGGRVNILLHVGFVGDNHVLNDGTPNSLTIRVTNPERLEKNVLSNNDSKLVLVFQGGELDEEWALATNPLLEALDVTTSQAEASVDRSGIIYSIDFNALEPGEWIDIVVRNIITNHPVGHTNLVVHYENIPGYRDGQFVLTIEKSPIVIQGKKVAIGPVSHRANLNIQADENTGGLKVQSASAGQTWFPFTNNWNYISGSGLILRDRDHLQKMRFDFNEGRVGIGTVSPEGTLHISSGTTGDCKLILQADTNNDANGQNPYLIFQQDGDQQQSAIYMDNNKLNIANSVSSSGGITFRTGTQRPYSNAIERMRITSGGNVGIGTDVPDSSLQVIPNADGYGIMTGDYRTGITRLPSSDGCNYIAGKSTFFQHDFLRPTIAINTEDGRLGIGTTDPVSKLHIGNSDDTSFPGIRIDGIVYEGERQYWNIVLDSRQGQEHDQDILFRFNGTTKFIMDPGGSSKIRVTSDERLKKDIEPLGSVLEKVCALKPSLYRWKENAPGSKKSMGFIAQEVEALFPDLVKEKEGYKNISYTDFGILAIGAIKEQQEEIKEQQEEIKSLKTQMEAQKKEQKSQQSLIELLVKRLDVLETKHH